MVIITDIHGLRQYIAEIRSSKKSIGFVPTMGSLHDGHLALVQASVTKNDITVCSIFVNPTQFNNSADLINYPRDTETDIKLLQNANCDMVFIPSTEDIYEKDYLLNLDFGYLEEIMEGKYRPGHFKGVGLVVTKLFNLVKPDNAYFGSKDLQQLAVIRTLTNELLFDIKIVPVETVREKDGLAMSSRNKLLSESQRKEAVDLYRALSEARHKLIEGDSVISVKKHVHDFFSLKSKIDLEYFEIVDSLDLKDIDQINDQNEVSLCIAGYLGKVRLIDNLSVF
jgi:pantoate--beta-alanine ligase